MRKLFYLLSLFILTLHFISAQEDFASKYGELSEFFGLDPNAGRNSFLILLIPSGGKYESMATAYTAMTEDLGFMDANPAVSAYLNRTEIMLLHNDWISDANIESIAYTQRIGDLGMGMATKFLWLPFESTNSYGATIEEASYSEGVMALNLSYNLFNNYYFDGLSFGSNFKIGYRHTSLDLTENQNAIAVMADAGLITRLNLLKFYASREKNFALGLSVKNLGVEFIDASDPLPSQATFGFAYKPIRPWTIAVDTTLPFNLNGEQAELVHVAIGTDIQATDFLSIQSGFLLKTGKPRFTLGMSLQRKNFTLYANYTLDLTTQFKPVDRMSVSIKYDLGDKGRMTVRDKVQELYLEGLDAYASGRYLEAISFWQECLELDAGFIPAQEMIETTEKSLELEEEMRELQRIE